MTEIFERLHLDLTALLWHAANFLILLVVLWRLFFRPITHLLDERARLVRESLARAEEIQRQAEQMEAARSELLSQAYEEASEIRARAEEQARQLLLRSRAEAREEADRILARAEGIARPSSSGSGAQSGPTPAPGGGSS